MDRIMGLLRGSFWKIDLGRFKLSQMEVDFLKEFFDIKVDKVVDDILIEEKVYLILQKKNKFITNPLVN